MDNPPIEILLRLLGFLAGAVFPLLTALCFGPLDTIVPL